MGGGLSNPKLQSTLAGSELGCVRSKSRAPFMGRGAATRQHGDPTTFLGRERRLSLLKVTFLLCSPGGNILNINNAFLKPPLKYRSRPVTFPAELLIHHCRRTCSGTAALGGGATRLAWWLPMDPGVSQGSSDTNCLQNKTI